MTWQIGSKFTFLFIRGRGPGKYNSNHTWWFFIFILNICKNELEGGTFNMKWSLMAPTSQSTGSKEILLDKLQAYIYHYNSPHKSWSNLVKYLLMDVKWRQITIHLSLQLNWKSKYHWFSFKHIFSVKIQYGLGRGDLTLLIEALSLNYNRTKYYIINIYLYCTCTAMKDIYAIFLQYPHSNYCNIQLLWEMWHNADPNYVTNYCKYLLYQLLQFFLCNLK